MSQQPTHTDQSTGPKYPIFSMVLAVVLAAITFWSLADSSNLIAGALAVTIFAATLWISEALPLAVTALLIPIGMATLGVFEESEAFTSFGSPILFLVLGGYALGSAFSANDLDRWIALNVLKHAGNSSRTVAATLMTLSALLSMILSNTATTALLLPVAIGMINTEVKDPNLSRLLPLSIAYGASIGGAATLVGSPPNAIAAGMLDIGFLQWLTYGIPISLGMLCCAIPILWITFRPAQLTIKPLGEANIELSAGGKRTLQVAAVVLTLWLFGPTIGTTLKLPSGLLDATAVGCFGVALLVFTRCVTWTKLQSDIQWGVLLLIGGGLTVGRGITESGAADWLGQLVVANIGHLPLIGLIVLFVAIAVFATELISNTAVTAQLAPVLMGVALQLGIAAESLVIPVAIASSMAFMLPVATPPNAMVHASHLVSQRDMMRAGISLNLAAVGVISVFFLWLV